MISKAKNEHFNPYPYGVWNFGGGVAGGGGSHCSQSICSICLKIGILKYFYARNPINMVSKTKNEHYNPYPRGAWNLGGQGGTLLPKYLLDLPKNYFWNGESKNIILIFRPGLYCVRLVSHSILSGRPFLSLN